MVRLHNEQKYSSTAKLARLLREHIKSDVEREGLEKMAEVTTDLAVRLAEPVGMVRNLLAQKTSDAIALVGAEEDDWPYAQSGCRPRCRRERQSLRKTVPCFNGREPGASSGSLC